MMNRVVVICPLEGLEQMAQSQWSKALKKLGFEVHKINLRSRNVDPRSDLERLIAEVKKINPEFMFVEGLLGFNLPEFYFHPDTQKYPIASFWFDDPYRSLAFTKKEEPIIQTLLLPNLYHFVWDGYWRDWLSQEYGIRSFPVHLAADPEDFHPVLSPEENTADVVFIGTLVANERIKAIRAKLPPVLGHIADVFFSRYPNEPYGALPYRVLTSTIKDMASKWQNAFEHAKEHDRENVRNLIVYAWMVGKNVTRVRMLKAATQVSPVLMLSGNLEKSHASANEVKALVGAGDKLKILDTSAFQNNLSEIYASGKVHIQATDPQSVNGGIPFRVFQTTACHQMLFTDKKPELAECYEYGKELMTYDSDEDLGVKLQRLFANSKDIETVANSGYERFLKQHTWSTRMEGVIKILRKQ